jgi:hypothetical protein
MKTRSHFLLIALGITCGALPVSAAGKEKIDWRVVQTTAGEIVRNEHS